MASEENVKRRYTRHEDSPGLSRDASPAERRRYDAWYYQNKRGYVYVSEEDKEKSYRSMSEKYWRGFCEEHGDDPDTWEEVKKRVETFKREEKARKWAIYRGYASEDRQRDKRLRDYYKRFGDDLPEG